MPHINVPGIDFVISIWLVHCQSVLLVKHKKLGGWFPVGGHIEPGETPDEAFWRELKEETGLTIDVVQIPGMLNLRSYTDHNTVEQLLPWKVNVHDFPGVEGHRHCALQYLARSKTKNVTLEAEAHDAILWFTKPNLPEMIKPVREYAQQAIDQIGW